MVHPKVLEAYMYAWREAWRAENPSAIYSTDANTIRWLEAGLQAALKVHDSLNLDEEDFTPWAGGGMPLDLVPGVEIAARLRNGFVMRDPCQNFRWSHTENADPEELAYDIVGYRLCNR